MKFSTVAALVAAAGSVAAAPQGLQQTVSPPSGVTIQAITYGGTGCPQGSASVLLAQDKTSFTIIFDQYTASVDKSTRQDRKNCQLSIDLNFPSGFSYSIGTVNYRGSAFLDKGVTGTQTATYFFAGYPAQASKATVFTGPYQNNNYVITDQFDLASIVWSPCGAKAPLSINSVIRLDNRGTGAIGDLTTDSIDGKVSMTYHMTWMKCPTA